jgi:hypothetical protein
VHAGIDGDRPHRRVRKDEAHRRPLGQRQFGNDRFEVVAVGAEAVQPDYGVLRVWPGLQLNRLQRHGCSFTAVGGFRQAAHPTSGLGCVLCRVKVKVCLALYNAPALPLSGPWLLLQPRIVVSLEIELSAEPEREFRRSLGSLKPALVFLRPYHWQIIGAAIALVITASVTLSIGQGLRLVIDDGFGAGLHLTEGQAVPDTDLLVRSLAVFAGLVLVLTAGTYVRFYLVSWVGERVSADIRRAVFDRPDQPASGLF